MCNIDQGWLFAYFQVVVSILLFGVGIPSLILQTVVSEDLRGIVRRHSRFLKWGYISVVIGMLALPVFAGGVMHCDVAGLSFVAALRSVFEVLGLGLSVNQWGNIIIALTTVGLVGGWSLRYRRDRLLRNLKRKCERRILRDGTPDEEVLDDIRYLGEQGKAGIEKTQVLEILEQLAFFAQTHEHYQGNGLEDIIKAIEFTLQKNTDDDSFVRGGEALQNIVEKMPKSILDSSSDVWSIIRTLGRLGIVAFTMNSERSARKIVETIHFISRAPDGAFIEATLSLSDLGVAALEHGQFLIAVEALNKLEAMTCQREPADAANSAAYLGLVAHFWSKGGSARRRALSGLKGIKFSPSRSKCLKSAQQSFYGTARFTTADLLSKMTAKL